MPERMLVCMDPVRLTRELIDIESITGNEAAVGDYLFHFLSKLGYKTRKMPVEGKRANVYATLDEAPELVFSTHMDTVPPFIPSSEDAENIYGRGSCDAKGIIAAQISAAERLRSKRSDIGLLFLVGEERDSQGAKEANRHAQGSKFLINGEPTDSKIGRASKGTLRVELTATGRMAHSAYPELGESAIEKLVEALQRLLKMPLPTNPEIGGTTFNIGLIEGGRAPNVIPDFAQAQLLYRLVGPTDELRLQIEATVAGLATPEFSLEIPYVQLRTVEGIPEMIAAFTTDIPALTNWGEPVLLGPGSIHVAHTDGEYISKRELHDAVGLYAKVAEQLLGS
jgi:acetylornithine deacetylase